MKKSLIALFALAALCTPAIAQENEDGNVRASRAGKNWEISLGLGASAYLSEEQETVTKSDAISFPMLGLSINKWASPVWGFGIEFDYAQMKHAYYANTDIVKVALFADPINDYHKTANTYIAKGYYFNPFVKVNLDFTNLFGGYRERVFNIFGYLGGGVIMPFGDLGAFNDNRKVNTTFNMGLTGRFNLGKKWAIDIALRSALVADEFNGICFESTNAKQRPVDIIANATLGLTYKFGFTAVKNHSAGNYTEKMYWVPESTAIACSKTLKDATDAAVADGEARAKAAEAKVKAAEDALAKAKAEAAEEIAKLKEAQKNATKADFDYLQLINFKLDKSNLSNREKVSIQSAADVIKASPNAKILIQGFADKQTGNEKYNLKLSEKRAQVVKDYLVNECGVDAGRIETVAKGGVDYMYFKDAQCSRSAIIVVAK